MWHFINGDMYTTIVEMIVLVVLYHLNCTVEGLRVLVVLYSSIVCNGSTVLIVLYSANLVVVVMVLYTACILQLH